MKAMRYILASALCMLVSTACSGNKKGEVNVNDPETEEIQAGAAKKDGKILVVFFSHAGDNYAVGNIKVGNTKIVADYISEITGADQFEIKTKKYDGMAYKPLCDLAKKEQQNGEFPPFEGSVDVSKYSTIFIGGPVWWGTYPQVMFTFFKKYNLNGKTVNWTADKDYTTGYVLAENEDLTITAGKTAEGTANWIHFDNFKLYFCGDVQAALTTLLGQVSDYNGAIPSAAYSALQTKVAAYDKSYSDVDDLLAAIVAVQALYADADLLKAPYTAYFAMKAKADALQSVDNDNNEANSTFATAISNQTAAAAAATTADDINTATSTLKAAMKTYVFAATPVGDGAKFDCTFLMTNPDLTGLPTWNAADGWESEETDGNSQVMFNDSKTNGDKSYFYEYWSNPAKASGKFALYNAVTLPAGTFSMSCYAFAEDQYTSTTVDGVYFYANDTQGSCVTANKLTEQSLSFVNDSEQEVKIGLKTLTGNTRNWMGIGYIDLYKVPAVTVEISEDVNYTPESVAGKVTLTRTLSTEKWNTFVVPFQITNEELKAAFGDNVAVAEYSETANGDNSTVSFTKMTTPAISANKPVLLKPETTAADNKYVFANRTVATSDAKVAGTNFDFTGTYDASTTIAAGDWFINADKLYKSTGATTIKGTRAYIKAKAAGARITNLTIDGNDATAIESLKVDNANGKIYNLQGQEVKKGQKGVFIQNGKKMVVK